MITKLVHSSRWELEKRLCGLEVGGAEVTGQTVSFLLMCVGVCGAEGGLGGHNQASKVALAAKY